MKIMGQVCCRFPAWKNEEVRPPESDKNSSSSLLEKTFRLY